MTLSDDCQLIVQNYKNGDIQSIELLDEKLGGMLKSIICKYIRTPSDFNEYYQVAWVAVMKCVKGYSLEYNTKFTSYVYIAVERELRQYKKKQTRNIYKYKNDVHEVSVISLDSPMMTADGVMTISDTLHDETIDIEREVILRTLIPEIDKIIESFANDKQREILYRFLEGTKQNVIAEQLKVHVTYVSKIVSQFYKKCEIQLNK